MSPTRRQMLQAGGVLLAGVGLSTRFAAAQALMDIRMAGTANGSAVWFDPLGLRITPGQTVRWTNVDPGNVHTATAYHPDNGRPLRIPDGTAPWDSGYLLPYESFEVTLTEPGVYDYFCLPHEHAGMVGRIVVVGTDPLIRGDVMWPTDGLPATVLAAFPPVAEILHFGIIAAPSR